MMCVMEELVAVVVAGPDLGVRLSVGDGVAATISFAAAVAPRGPGGSLIAAYAPPPSPTNSAIVDTTLA
jgi:hypothetical protein